MRTKTQPQKIDPAQRREKLAENIDPALALARWSEGRGLDEAALADLTARARRVADRCAH